MQTPPILPLLASSTRHHPIALDRQTPSERQALESPIVLGTNICSPRRLRQPAPTPTAHPPASNEAICGRTHWLEASISMLKSPRVAPRPRASGQVQHGTTSQHP
ncbi:hypothetical protein D7B24_006422 [Verticillium nonalfalfae]|uniref:Uncharacterized protein n=1 Tax=Verticillium nonalfalfae TaxID=1051616 RepID=A0A3M9YBK1_9PEZI|nr:uncharacterized protein D7B24_006422 [Verticillium nonalfalfae]RNJ57146.1 hypothetical protein D7B24_006422 [Verticillium nonalfalfae]